jgi:hypothetical protein
LCILITSDGSDAAAAHLEFACGRWGYHRGESGMFTSAECLAHAEAKLAQADRDDRYQRRLLTAAEALSDKAIEEFRIAGEKLRRLYET